jgi:hypothetical protein
VAAAAEPIVLRGKPANLAGRLGFVPRARHALIELELPGDCGIDGTVHAAIVPTDGGKASRIVARADRFLAPGKYAGRLALDEASYPVRAEVAPRPHARFEPRRIDTEAAPGAELEVKCRAVNNGNTELVVPDGGDIELFPGDVFERREAAALLASFEFPAEPGHEDALAAKSAGRARIVVEKGAGPLGPRESRELELRVELPAKLACDEQYQGSWSVMGRSMTLAVRTVG